MLALPADIPVTTPVVGPTVAIAVLLLLHVPPATASVKVVVVLKHTVEKPAIVPEDKTSTVTVLVALALPQALVSV